MRAHNSVLAVYFDLILELLDGVSASHPSPSTSAAETKKEKKISKNKNKNKKILFNIFGWRCFAFFLPFFPSIQRPLASWRVSLIDWPFVIIIIKKKKKWVAMEFTLCCFDFLCLLAQFVYFCLFAVFVPSPPFFFFLNCVDLKNSKNTRKKREGGGETKRVREGRNKHTQMYTCNSFSSIGLAFVDVWGQVNRSSSDPMARELLRK